MLDAVVQVVREATGELHALVFHELGAIHPEGLSELVDRTPLGFRHVAGEGGILRGVVSAHRR